MTVGEKVLGRESMCMMTSNVFGYIAAQNTGYAKVELQETIARGYKRVPRGDLSSASFHLDDGREYFRTAS